MENATGKLTSNGIEVFRGSEVTHGSDVTLVCPKGHVPDKATFSCKYGQFDVAEVPHCDLGKLSVSNGCIWLISYNPV